MEENKKFPGFPEKPEENYWQYPKICNGFWHLLTGAEQKVLDYILRHTWGYNKTADKISLSQFQKGIRTKDGKWIDRGTGLSQRQIIRALQKLEVKGFVKGIREKGKSTTWSLVTKCQNTSDKMSEVTSDKMSDTINNSTINNINNKNNGESKDSPASRRKTKRKDFRVPAETYKRLLSAYQKYKGISLKGAEFGEVKRAIKTMLYSGRTEKEIIDFMKFCSEVEERIRQGDEQVTRELGWLKNWTIHTIRRKLSEYLAGKFNLEDEEVDYPNLG